MLKKLPSQPQLEMFKTVLASFINPQHELCLLAKEIDWDYLEKEFAPLYGEVGRPSIPIRTIVGLLLLKQIYNLGDETVMERYIDSPYCQHFCGEIYFQYRYPFDPSDFVHFRKRIGEEGMKKIFKQSIDLFGKENVRKEVKEVRVDTTVQEKNITFPTDRKLTEKVIEYCKRIAKKEDIKLKRTYTFEIRKLKQQLRFARKPKNMKKHIKAQKKLHRIAFKIYQDLVNQLNPIPKSYMEEFDVLYRVLTQQKDDKNKVYSIHEPEVLCISKGKEHKKYEFGNKSSFAYTRGSGIIVGAMAVEGNAYDGHTLKPQLEQVKELTGGKIKKAIVDKGYKVKGGIAGVDIVMPKMLKGESYYLKKKREERCRSRAGIEGLISHLKYDHRMIRNYLSGTSGDQINTLLAATAYNMNNKYSMILGNLGNTCDRFCKGYKTNPTSDEMLEMALKKIPFIEGIELVGTWDIRPDNVKDMKKRLNDYGVACSSIIPDTFTDPDFAKGSITSIVPAIRQKAVDYLRQMSEVALKIDCKLINLWLGQDGYDYLLTADYNMEREWLKESTMKLATEFPGLKFALEYKPKEPRNFSYHARMADTILAAKETQCSNVGITIDTGHSFIAGENVSEAVVLAKRAGDLLYHMHFNDNHGSWDDDMIVGTVHSVVYVELLFWLKKTGYKGWLSMDQYPYREDAVDAISESILWVKKFESIVDEYYNEIETLIKLNDAVETSRFLRKLFK